MNRVLAREIAGCLRVAGSPKEHVKNLAVFSRGDWKRAQEWLDHSGVALWFWDRFKGLGACDAVPQEVGARLEQNLVAHRLRVASMAEEFDSLNRSFANAGVEYAVLKGFALTPEYVPDPRLRPAYDFDYLLPPDSLERSEQALRNGGYIHRQEDAGHDAVYKYSARIPRVPVRRDDLYSATLHRAVEVHTRLWEAERQMIPLPLQDDFLARKRLRHWQGLSFYSLAEEDELMFQVLHAFGHILGNWCRLCTFLEIAHFLERRRSDAEFWQRFYERIRHSPPLPEMVGVVISLAVGLFGAPVPTLIDAGIIRTMRYPLTLWLTRYGGGAALSNFEGNKCGRLLHREFVRDGATWRKTWRKRLFHHLWRPSSATRASTSEISARLAAGFKQGSNVARRLFRILIATVPYTWEVIQWKRVRSLRQ